MNELDKKIIASIQADIPITERPFLAIARELGIEEEMLLEKIDQFSKAGIIRRFGATLRHQKSGFSANAMGAWEVDETRIEAVGQTFADFSQVSHCYRRNPTPAWPYNLYTMIHAQDKASCKAIARQMAAAAAVENYALLFSKTELKKTSMLYFPTDEDD